MDQPVDKAAALVSGPRQQRWLSLLTRLVDLGTEGYPPKTRRRLKILNAMAYLIVVFSALYALTYALEGAWMYRWAIAINLALVLVGLAVPASHRLHETAGGLLIAASECAALFALVALLGRRSGIQLNLIVGASAPFVCFGLDRLRMVIGLVGLTFILHVAAWFLFPTGAGGLEPDPAFLGQLYLSSAITAFSVTAVLVYYAFTLAERAEAETEGLLRNILPESVVERLKARPGEAVADTYAEVSVLFSDLKGFVPLSKALGAAGTVAVLNDLVHGFDRLAAEHGIEKIKTIGDAYMAVAGLPEPAPDHAARLARMALDMRRVAEETGRRHGVALALRIGMASGPVMAGVIGTRKFSYDVWGDPVNLAARLESTGEPERIQVSAEMRARLADAFDFAPRGPIEIKGVGRQETWFLIGPRTPDRSAAEPAT